ncbi:hypothetical protein TBLA_0B00230 [Henningerozyma blattae CBS 6284]|uniref:G-patch domain-containing protein n=1 Tax=Henningerozyma blattae (strain ATCC 34711 / CBS 6284 / DSM 70876 / NBRC 10599 / NRRL Y-10934 / UCD 77-7) TaxID=1071380 RepID=I2GXL6_HENB6|nr:hypothetical protein TBLA_0B00230 [Tetrapisispora blattae CBS 6284]CCH58868.1 hypothetical protein TBLA_0B00230 [Tetrapisispora blattae CBS 6284]
MAKRHKHFDKRNTKPKTKGKNKNKGKSQGKNKSNKPIPFNPDLLQSLDGTDDIYLPSKEEIQLDSFRYAESYEQFYFNKKKSNMQRAGLKYFNDNLDNNTRAFRKRPVEFIKAKNDYNPSKELFIKLGILKEEEKNDRHNLEDELKGELESKSEAGVGAAFDIEQELDLEDGNDLNNLDEDIEVINNSDADSLSRNTLIEDTPNHELFFIDEGAVNTSTKKCFKSDRSINKSKDIYSNINSSECSTNSSQAKISKDIPNLEFNPILTIGKTELQLENKDNQISVTSSYSNYISNVMNNVINNSESDIDNELELLEESKIEPSNEEFAEREKEYDEREITKIRQPNSTYEFDSHLSVQDDLNELHIEDQDTKNDEPEIPEFGMLDEDYVVNFEELQITNIRFSVDSNSYYLKCFGLLGNYNFQWIDELTLQDYLIDDLSLPEYRFKPFLNYIENLIIPKEESITPNYSDIPFSSSSEEEDEVTDTFTEDMNEGLEDLILSMTKNEKQRMNIEYNPLDFDIKTLKTKGRGKKRKLLVDDDLDPSIKNLLISKFDSRNKNKVKKRKDKLYFIDLENQNSNDLFKKYPRGLHILNIYDEFEIFLKSHKKKFSEKTDSTLKDSLLFPPLDPHGNKILKKFATLYNMNSKKMGKGNKTHMLIQLNKNTIRKSNSINYNMITNLTKQRPIFMRIDTHSIIEKSDIHYSDDTSRRNTKTTTTRLSSFRKGKFNLTEGEIVGHNAPEIGKENIGRRLLEKLGWKNGEGLGVDGNMGINLPITAKVKKTKAGLK